MAVSNVIYPPLEFKVLDDEGKMSEQWSNYMRSLTNLTSNNFNQQGLNAPTLATTEFAGTENGSMYYDNDDDVPKIIVDGVVKTITTS